MLGIRVVFPMFFMLAVGYGIRLANLVSEEVFDGCSTLVFKVMIPVNLFLSVGQSSIGDTFDPKLVVTAIGGVCVFWLLNMLIVPRLEKDDRKRGAMVQGAYRSNTVLFGIPIAQTIAGADAVAAAAVLIVIIVPLYNVLAVVTLESFRGGKVDFKTILKGIAKNPLIIGTVCGLLFFASGLEMPAVLEESLSDLSSITTPLALIALGGTFHFTALRGNLRQLMLVVVSKLILMPAFILTLGMLLGVGKLGMAVLIGIAAAPVAVSSFTMAQKMGSDGELAGQIVVFTVLMSIPTLFLWVFGLSSLGLI